jgi:hypothetical protein
MRCVLPQVESFGWERHHCIEFLPTHRRVVESLQVDDKQFWKPVQSDVLLNIDWLLTALTFVACIYNFLHIYEFLHAIF